METEDLKPSEEEIQEDEAAQAEVKEDEIREKLATELGIEDSEDNKDLLDKMVAREMTNHGKLAKAIGQKIKFRDLASGKKPDSGKKPVQTAKPKESEDNRTTEEIMEEKFMQRDLDEMDHSDSIKDQIKKVAQMNGISVRKAEQDSYIQHLIAEEAKSKAVDNAAKNGKNNSKTGTVVDVSKPLDPADFDLSTEEGRAEWQEAKKARAEARKEQ